MSKELQISTGAPPGAETVASKEPIHRNDHGEGGSQFIAVLLIEDNPDDVLLTKEALATPSAYHFELEFADSLSSGLKCIKESNVDLILLDLSLPDSRGLDTFRHVSAQAPHVPIIICTGAGDEEVRLKAATAGAQDYMIKGELDGNSLQRAIRYALERHKLMATLAHQSEELQSSRNQLCYIIEKNIDGTVVIDTNGVIRFINPAAEALFGRKADELINEQFGFPIVAGQTAELDIIRGDGKAAIAEIRVVEVTWENEDAYLASLRDVTERRRAEEQLHLQATALHSAANGILITAADGKITWANPAVTKLTGYTLDELVGQNSRILQSTEQDKAFYHDLWTTILAGEVWQGELINCRKDGSHYNEEMTITPVKNDDGKIANFIAIKRDITEETGSKERERFMASSLQTVVEATDELIACPDMESLFRRAVELAREKLDIERCAIFVEDDGKVKGTFGTDMNGRTTDDQDLTMPMDKVWKNRFNALIGSDKQWTTVEEAGSYPSGKEVIKIDKGRVVITPIPASDTSNTAFGIFVNDTAISGAEITDIKQDILAIYCSSLGKIAEIKRSEQRVREQAALLDITADAVLVLDLNNKIIYWNKGAQKLYGYEASEVLGKEMGALVNDSSISTIDKIRVENRVTGEWRTVLSHTSRDGKKLTVESVCTVMLDEKKQAKAILMVNADITEKMINEQQLLRSQRIDSIGTLAGGIAHDLNNVLAPILLAIQMLKMKLPQDEFGKILETIETSAKRGAGLVKQIFTFARGSESEKRLLQINDIIKEVKDMIHDTLPNDVTLKIEVPRDLNTVLGDATQLHQVFLNLCVNARDAMPDGGEIRITARNVVIDKSYAMMSQKIKCGSYVVVNVTDTGSGIPKEIIDRIFEPYFTTKDIGKGTGLGLATSLGILTDHKGLVDIRSKVGTGTTFEIYLPVVKTESLEETVYLNVALPKGHGEIVLVVDDEASIREIVKESLECYGYQALTASNGAEAIRELAREANNIAAVIMDIDMPVMDGTTAIPALRSIDNAIKIILMSGIHSHTKLTDELEEEIDAYLTKPFAAEILLNTLANVLRVAET